MACETRFDDQGRVTMILCGRSRRQSCKFCSTGYVTKLCDFPTVGRSKTCDAGMCSKCATNVRLDLDYCPNHKHQAPPPQRQLFQE